MRIRILVALLVFSFVNTLFAQRRTQSLSEFKQTEFVTTLENKIHPGKNAVYSAALLLGWDRLRDSLGGSIEVDSVDRDLYLFNRSRDFENALLKTDYTASFNVAYNSVHVKASFKKTLPFLVPMTSYATELAFEGKEVPAFGEKGEGRGSAAVRYYKDDENVVVQLFLEIPSHEIYFFKTVARFHTLREATNALEESIKAGSIEMTSGTNPWKFDFASEDKLIIPKVRFDIRTDFANMEEKVVHSGRGVRLDVMELTQQTTFALNEKGIEIEATGGERAFFKEPVVDEARKPKKIIFDKPFFIFLKHKDSANPYLILWIANSELMK